MNEPVIRINSNIVFFHLKSLTLVDLVLRIHKNLHNQGVREGWRYQLKEYSLAHKSEQIKEDKLSICLLLPVTL